MTGSPGSGVCPSTYGFLQFAAVGSEGGAAAPLMREIPLKSSSTRLGGSGE